MVDMMENQNNQKRKISDILFSWKFLICISIFIFIFTLILSFKSFYLRSKVNDYKKFFVEIEQKEEPFTKIIKTDLMDEEIGENVQNIINEINNYYNQSNNYFAFAYKDLHTGFTVIYNGNQPIFTASTIKAPADIYIYEMASLGEIDLSKKLKYTGNYYNVGTGVLKNKSVDTEYDIKTLLEYSIVYSDNAAHNMLMDYFGRNNMYDFWKRQGTNVIFSDNNNWGVINAHDALIYMEELYKFYITNETYGPEIMNNFFNAVPKFISGKNSYKVANKSGWSGSAIHDVSIVFAENPYIVVALSNLGGTNNYYNYFSKVNDMAYRLHTEYWKDKINNCSSISQYK